MPALEPGLRAVALAARGFMPPDEGDALVAAAWRTPLAMLFLDGAHGPAPARADYEAWAPHVAAGGMLAIHDVFPDPADGGRPPHELWCRALASGAFTEVSACGSLRVLRRQGAGC